MIRGWESGEHKPSEASRALLAEAFKPATSDWLAAAEDNPQVTAEWQLLCGTLVAVLSSKGSEWNAAPSCASCLAPSPGRA